MSTTTERDEMTRLAAAREAYDQASQAASQARRERSPELADLAERAQQAHTEWLDALREQHSPDLSLAQAEVIMELAWQEGHSSGYEQVEYHYSDYADMIARVIALG